MARVLIIEPEPDLRMLARDAVAELGHEPVTAKRYAERCDVDVVLVAVASAAQAAALGLRAGKPPVVVVGSASGREHAGAIEASAYLPGPYSLRDLEHAIAKVLRK